MAFWKAPFILVDHSINRSIQNQKAIELERDDIFYDEWTIFKRLITHTTEWDKLCAQINMYIQWIKSWCAQTTKLCEIFPKFDDIKTKSDHQIEWRNFNGSINSKVNQNILRKNKLILRSFLFRSFSSSLISFLFNYFIECSFILWRFHSFKDLCSLFFGLCFNLEWDEFSIVTWMVRKKSIDASNNNNQSKSMSLTLKRLQEEDNIQICTYRNLFNTWNSP